MEDRADDLRREGEDLPQPGTKEPPAEKESDGESLSTEGPGNVSIDEPTEPVMSPDPDEEERS
jgi:hypothetical protein